MSGGDKAKRKQNYFARLQGLLEEYPKILLVQADNVGSNHMQRIRASVRKDAVILMGKNTMMRKAIRGQLEKNPKLEGILPYVYGNIGFVFTKGELAKVRDKISDNKVQAAAKAGAVSPVDVIVPAGPTGQEPTKTSFFQALSIQTKINRGAIEILSDVPLIKAGQKVTVSQATLLQMLDIKPFQYGLSVTTVYDNGNIYDASILDLTDDDLLNKFRQGVNNIAALSLEIGVPTLASLPHSIINGFKSLLAVAVETEYSFPRADKIKHMLANPEAFAAAAAPAASSAPAAAAPAKEETKEEEVEEDFGGGGLFGDDDDY
ncbi:60S acidic ribosomal protein P0 [Balamuthia mandrillaris]